MAGTFLTVDTDNLKSVGESIREILNRSQNLKPAIHDIAEHVLESTQQRFLAMETPDGDAWEPLAFETLARKERQDRILTESGTLADTIHYLIENDEVQIGSNLEYAATHQFGRDNIAERPFLGLSNDDTDEILDILQSHLLDE